MGDLMEWVHIDPGPLELDGLTTVVAAGRALCVTYTAEGYGVLDNRNRPYSRASIHNWFVGRALDVLRPGGLVCFITSTYFLDESDAGMRAHVASEADLVTAFRLPSGTFERIASTSVQADLVVLRKRAPGEAAAAAEGTNPPSDTWASADFRRHLAQVLTGRALAEAGAK